MKESADRQILFSLGNSDRLEALTSGDWQSFQPNECEEKSRTRPLDTVFCAADSSLDAELRYLHRELLLGNPRAQVEIDRRLHACIAAEGGWKQHPVFGRTPLAWLYTEPEDTVQFLRLPDLLRFLTRGTVKQSWTGNIFEVLMHNSLPCLKKGRLVQLPEGEGHSLAVVACVNMLHGTLLGLYPHCAKAPTFHVRKSIVGAIRALTVSGVARQQSFLARLPSLVKLCTMEYIMNATREFCPSEMTHYMSHRGINYYHGVCSGLCDGFRTDALQSTGWSWEALDSHAALLVERFSRTCKFRVQRPLVGGQQALRRVIGAWRKGKGSQGSRTEVLRLVLELPRATQPNTLRFLLQSRDGSEDADQGNTLASIVESVQANVTCHAMPGNLVRLAADRLQTHFQQDPHRIHCASKVHVCMWCVNKASGNPIQQKLRLDVERGQLACATCGGGSPVVRVNLFGRFLRIGQVYYFFCPCCCKIHPWNGDGTEFNSRECYHAEGLSRAKKGPCRARPVKDKPPEETLATPTRVHAPPRAREQPPSLLERLNDTLCNTVIHRKDCGKCLCCDREGAANYVYTFHAPLRQFVTVFLCNKHRVPPHMQRYIFDTRTLKDILISRARQ